MARCAIALLWLSTLLGQIIDVAGRLAKPKNISPKLVESPKNASNVKMTMSRRGEADLKEHQFPMLPVDSAMPSPSPTVAPCQPTESQTLPPCQPAQPCQPASAATAAPCQVSTVSAAPPAPPPTQQPLHPCPPQLPMATTPAPMTQVTVAPASLEGQLAALRNELAIMDMRLGAVEAENLQLKAQMQRIGYGGPVATTSGAPVTPTVPALPAPITPAPATLAPAAPMLSVEPTQVPLAPVEPTQIPLAPAAPMLPMSPQPPPANGTLEYPPLNLSMPTLPPLPGAAGAEVATPMPVAAAPVVATPMPATETAQPGLTPAPGVAYVTYPPPPRLDESLPASLEPATVGPAMPHVPETLPEVPLGQPFTSPPDLQPPVGTHGHVSMPPPPPLPPLPVYPYSADPTVPEYKPDLGSSVADILASSPAPITVGTPGSAVLEAAVATPDTIFTCQCSGREAAEATGMQDLYLENALVKAGMSGMKNPVLRKNMAREMRKVR